MQNRLPSETGSTAILRYGKSLRVSGMHATSAAWVLLVSLLAHVVLVRCLLLRTRLTGTVEQPMTADLGWGDIKSSSGIGPTRRRHLRTTSCVGKCKMDT